MTDRTFAVVVGTGYVGRRVLAQLPADAAAGLNRSPLSCPQAIHRFDLDRGGPLPIALPDHYAVLYTVAPSAEADTDVRLERLLAELRPAPDRFVYISTTGVYGDRRGAVVDERSDLRPATVRARRRVAAETRLQAWSDAAGTRLCILRVPGIYGPGRLGLSRIRAGAPVLREADAHPGNRIHVDDLVGCCLAALRTDAPDGIFNVGDGDQRSSTWFTREVARQAGLAAPLEIDRDQATREFSPQRLSFMSESRRVDTRKMRAVLGVTPRYANAEDGIRASLAEEDL